jgi:hypothetical protein
MHASAGPVTGDEAASFPDSLHALAIYPVWLGTATGLPLGGHLPDPAAMSEPAPDPHGRALQGGLPAQVPDPIGYALMGLLLLGAGLAAKRLNNRQRGFSKNT